MCVVCECFGRFSLGVLGGVSGSGFASPGGGFLSFGSSDGLPLLRLPLKPPPGPAKPLPGPPPYSLLATPKGLRVG